MLSSEYLFRRPPWLTLRQERLRLPTGREIAEYWISEYPPWVNVVAVTPTDEVVLIRQYRPGLRQVHFEIPAGVVDGADPDLLAAARRELAEETGAVSVTYLGRTDGWVTYDFPPLVAAELRRGWKGQKQVWFAFRFDGDEAEFDLAAHQPPEFEAWRWAYLAETPELIVPFKRTTYEAVAKAFAVFAAPRPTTAPPQGELSARAD